MLRVSRFKFLIFATIVCVILSCIAAFSVSFAKWTLGDNSNATKVSQGKAANFYVEYPQYVSGSEESDITIPPLSATKYYMQVPQRGNIGTADFYEFKSHSTANEVKLESVYLYPGDVLSLFYGKTYKGITSSGTGENLSDDKITFDSGKYTVQSNGEGFYNFYYNHSSGSMWTVFVGKPSENGDDNNQGNTIDTTGFTELFSIKFSDDAQVKKLYFKTGTSASSPYDSLDNFAVHIRKRNPGADGYYYNTNTYPGKTGAGDGNMRYVRTGKVDNALEGQTLNVGTKAETVIVFGFEQAHMSNAATHSGEQDLKEYAVGETNLIILHTAKNVAPKLKTSGLGGGSNPADDLTPIAPDYEGTTDFHSGGTVTQTVNGKKTVRKVTSGAQESGTKKYVYNNYICISRKNSAATDDDNSIAYLEFEVADSTVNPYYVKVTSLTLKRRATDASGNIKDRFVDPAPRIYNYDPNLDTRLGPDNDTTTDYSNPNKEFTTEADKAAARKPLFARGIRHDSFESSAGHMKKHYDDGVYVVLYFGDNDQQYFALDIEIELEIAAGVTVPDGGFDFTLKAQAANSNSWERYEDGYGEPWGYYLGGLINSVETWDPSRTTKLERANDRYKTEYNAGLETPIVGNIETASDATINAFNERSDFNYKIIRYYKSTGALEGYARYPKGKIDVSLTVNLIEGSLIKMYMVDHDGHRLDGHTVYVVPSEIVYDTETKKLFIDETYDIYDTDLNIIIPKTGTYIFRLVGYFRERDEEVESTDGNILKGDKICFEDGKRYEEIPTGKNGMGIPNFNLFVDTLYITCSSASEGNSECTITLNATDGATFNAEDIKEENGDTATKITRKVTFGSDIRNLPKPVHPNEDKDLLGWYYEDADGNTFDFDFGSAVTGNMTLYTKWEAYYQVTFNANGGNLPSGAVNPVITDEYGNLTKAQWDAVKPTYAGHKFLGWYTAQTGGTKLGTDTTFTADRTVYAHWEVANENGIYVNGVFKAPFVNHTTNEEVKVVGFEVTDQNDTITAWYNQVACAVKSGNPCGVAEGTTAIKLAKGVYTFYYRYAGTGEKGLWINLDAYIVTFDANEGTFTGGVAIKHAHTGAVTSGNATLTSANVPANPTRTDYSFGGWYTAASGGTKVTTPAKSYSSSTTLYAHWIEQVTVTLNANDGAWSGGVTQRSHKVDINTKVATSIANDEPTRANYRFAGWYTDRTDGTVFNLKTTNISADTELWAHWTALYTVTFHNNDGTSGVFKTLTNVEDNTTITEPSDKPTRSGYAFKGWYKDAACNTAWNFATDKVSATNKDLYAKWEEITDTTYRVILDVSSWPGYDHANVYTYHIYANGTGDGDEMVPMGSNKYYFDLADTAITKIRFTQDQKDTHNELSRHEVSVSGLTLGGEYTYTPTISNVTIDGTNQIGLKLNNGIVILNAAFDSGWTATNRPSRIHMWKASDAAISGGWPGGPITYGKFTEYNCDISDIYGIILTDGTNKWTGDDITPGINGYDQLANGKIYNIKEGVLSEKQFSGSGDEEEYITIKFTGPAWADAKSARVSYVTDDSTVNSNYDNALEMEWSGSYNGTIVIPKPKKIRMFFKQTQTWISSEITMTFEAGKTYTMTTASYSSESGNIKYFTTTLSVS